MMYNNLVNYIFIIRLRVLGLQRDQTSPSYRKSVLNICWKNWCWSWNSKTLATWCKEQTQWKRPWCWERLKAGGEGGKRGLQEMVGLWTWVWVSSGSWWWTGKPFLLESMRSQMFRHDWAIEVNWNRTDTFTFSFYLIPPGIANSSSQQLYQINQEGNSLIGTESSRYFGDF